MKKVKPPQNYIKRNRGISVITPKGKQHMKEDVIASAKGAGLVDTKVVSFSESHTALQRVIPNERR